jgi:hypothetical protein
VLVCAREELVPTLAVRPACVQDHDDLAPLMAAQAASLQRTYGAFFLAELIEAADRVHTHVLVAEAGGKVVRIRTAATLRGRGAQMGRQEMGGVGEGGQCAI